MPHGRGPDMARLSHVDPADSSQFDDSSSIAGGRYASTERSSTGSY